MRTRIVPYVPFGAKLPALPDPLEVQVVTPMGELSTATVQYPRAGLGATTLDDAIELGFEYLSPSGSWIEPPNARFLSMRGDFDHLEETPTRKYSFVSVGWLLRGARVWEPSGLPVDADGKVQFLSASAGKIMATLIGNAKARGWGAGLSIDFSATKDSAGANWSKIITIAYDVDLDLETILTNLYQQGVCDFRFEGRTLRIFNPDAAMGRDLTTGTNPLRLIVADGQTATPEAWTNEDLLTDALVLGEGGRRWNFANAGRGPFGRLEKVIAQGGVSDPGTAALLADQDLIRGSATRISFTPEFMVTPDTVRAPFRDYGPGDWVLAQRGMTFERFRTQSVSITVTGTEMKGHAVLGDRLEDVLTKLAKRTKGITGGAVAGGSGVRPAPEGPDRRTPAAPTGLIVDPQVYLNSSGVPAGQVTLNWAHSGHATDGTAQDVDRFTVQYRVNALGEPWKALTTTDDTFVTYSPLKIFKSDGTTPEEYAFRVRAVGENGIVSAWSSVRAVEMVVDTEPPPVPYFAASHVTTWLRTVTVKWTGKGTTTGANQVPMPRDFSHVNVYRGSAADMADAALVGQIRDVSTWTSEGMQPTVTAFYALSSVDTSGNESDRSPAFPITPADNVDISLITDELDAAKVQITNAGNMAVESGVTLAEKLAENAELASRAGQQITTSRNAPTATDGAEKAEGALWTQVDTAGAQIGFWRWDGTAWDPMPLSPSVIPTIQIGSGTAGQMDVSRLGATVANIDTAVVDKLWTDVVRSRRITTDMMLVGPGPNLMPDPGFTDPDLQTKILSNAAPEGEWALTMDGPNRVWRYVGHTTTNATLRMYDDAPGTWIAVQPGDSLRLRHEYRLRGNSVAGATSLHRWALYRHDAAGAYMDYVGAGSQSVVVGTGPNWTVYEYTYTVPLDSGVSYIRPVIQIKNDGWTGEYEVKNPSVVLATDASLIVDGTILGKHLAADTITGREVKALTITAGHIANNTITSNEINVGSIKAAVLTANSISASMISSTAIDGKIITGSTWRTNANAATVGGIQIDNVGIRAWAPDGEQTFSVSKSTGNVSIVGSIRSSSLAGNQFWAGGDMRQSGASGMSARPGIVFKSDASEYSAAAVYRDGSWGAVMIDSPYSSTGSYNGQSTISVANNGIRMWASKQGAITGPSNASSEMLSLDAGSDNWLIGGGGTANKDDGRIKWSGGMLSLRRNSGHIMEFRTDRSTVFNTSRLETNGSFYAASKNFKIEHPTKPGYDLYHGCTESPFAGVEYWGEAQLDDRGIATVALPDYFEALTKKTNRAVLVTPKDQEDLLVVTDIEGGHFSVNGTPGQRFTWLVKAERVDADFAVEQPSRPITDGEPDPT